MNELSNNVDMNKKMLQLNEAMDSDKKESNISKDEGREICEGIKSISNPSSLGKNYENKCLNIREKITVVELDEAKRRITSRLMKGLPKMKRIQNINEKTVNVGTGQVIVIKNEVGVVTNDTKVPKLENEGIVLPANYSRPNETNQICKTNTVNLVCVKKQPKDDFCNLERNNSQETFKNHQDIKNENLNALQAKKQEEISSKDDITKNNLQFSPNGATILQLDNLSDLNVKAGKLADQPDSNTILKKCEAHDKVAIQEIEKQQCNSDEIKQELPDHFTVMCVPGQKEDILTVEVLEQEQFDYNATMQVQENEQTDNDVTMHAEEEQSDYNVTMQVEEHEQVIVLGEDGQVLIVQKEGNEGHMIVGDYVQESSETLMQVEDMDHQKLISNNAEVYDSKEIVHEECEEVNSENTSDEAEGERLQSDGLTIVHVDKRSKKRVLTKVVKGHMNKNQSAIEKEEGQVVDKLTCKFCFKKFTKSSNKLRHLRTIHNVKKNIGSHIRCIECDSLTFKHVNKLREHLQFKHNLDMSEQELHFPNMNAFKKWKCEIERKNLCSYTLRHGFRKTTNGPKYFYMCHRSGKYLPKVMGERQRMLRVGGTCKLGIVCTAAIYCQERPNEVVVKYIPHHYGHGKETSFVQLSPEEQSAIQESVSNGVPFEQLLDDIRESQSKDTFQLFLLKKRDFRWINGAFSADEYNPGISDAESVENWVRRCCEMEDSPVLFYQQQNIGSDQEEFLLVIMTEFQKHILLSSNKDVICIDSLYRRKGGRFYLTVLLVMDEFDNAFPVAFSISNKVDKDVILQFFTSVKESTGSLSVKYFMSDSEAYFYESWVHVMNDEPRWLWSIWYVDSKIRTQLKIFKGNVSKRAEVYKTMRLLLECQNEDVFKCMFKNFIENLHSTQFTKELGNFVLNKYGSNAEMWASCYRKEVDLSTNIHLEVMHRTFRYCCREGRKKRLDKFLFVVLKFIKCKMLDRFANMLDEEKLNLAIEAINMCHIAGLEILSESISALSEKIWLINCSDNEDDLVYVTKELDKCPEHCSLRCEECDICVHQYSCSCVHSMINANLCMHIHAVVWKFLTPHFSPASSPLHTTEPLNNDDVNTEVDISNCSTVFDDVLKRTHDVYKKVKANRCNLNRDALMSIMKKLNDCVDICAGKRTEEPVQPTTTIPNNPVYLINPYVKTPSQPFILPNSLPSARSHNNGPSQYIVLLPTTSNISK